jgi:hypothetical protein
MGWAGNVWTGVTRWIEAERLWDEVRGDLAPTGPSSFDMKH